MRSQRGALFVPVLVLVAASACGSGQSDAGPRRYAPVPWSSGAVKTDGPAYAGPAWPFDIPTPAAQPARTPAAPAGREHAAVPRGKGGRPGVVRTGAPAAAGAGASPTAGAPAAGGASPTAGAADASPADPVTAHGDERPRGDTAIGTGDAAIGTGDAGGPPRDWRDGGGRHGPPDFPGFPGTLGFPGFPDGGGFHGTGIQGLPAMPGMPLDGGGWDHRREWTGDRG